MSIDVTDTGHGPPLILLHGWGQTRRPFEPLAEALAARGVRTVAFDFPGHGTRKSEPGPYTYHRFANDVATVVRERIGDEPYHLLGWSMGGTIAATLVAQQLAPAPQSLTLLSATPRFVAPDRESVGVGQPKGAVVKMRKKMEADPESGLAAFVALFFASGEAIDEERQRHIAPLLRDPATFPPATEAIMATLVELMETDLLPLGPVDFVGPVLSITGALDRIAPTGGAKLWERLFPQVEIVRFPGVGHAPQLTALDATADAIVRQIRGCAR